MNPTDPFDVTEQEPFSEAEEKEVVELANEILDGFEEELADEIDAGNYRQALIIGQAWLLAAKGILRIQQQAIYELFSQKPTGVN